MRSAAGSVRDGEDGFSVHAEEWTVTSDVRVGVFNNRRAGGGGVQTGDRAARVAEWLRGRSDLDSVETDATGVAEGLHELARRGVNVLVVNGGDGTLQRVLTEILSRPIFERLPLMVPLRSGRTNMSALDVGSARDPLKALATLTAAAGDGSLNDRLVERPVLRVEMAGEHPPQYGLFCGFGAIHRAIELTHRLFPPGRAQGVFGSAIVTAVLVARLARGSHDDEVLRPDRMEIVLDGTRLAPTSFTAVLATTMQRFFLGIRPFWGAERAPVRFTAIAEGAMGMGAAVDILRGRAPRRARADVRLTSRNIERADVACDCGLTVDGEMFAPLSGRHVRLDAPRRVRFVRTDT